MSAKYNYIRFKVHLTLLVLVMVFGVSMVGELYLFHKVYISDYLFIVDIVVLCSYSLWLQFSDRLSRKKHINQVVKPFK